MKWMLVVCLMVALAAADERDNEHSHCNFDIMVLVDSSGSITEGEGNADNFDLVKSFITSLVDDIDDRSPVGDRTRIGVLSYSNKVNTDVELADNLNADEIATEVNDIEYQGSVTKMYEAVTRARSTLFDPATQRPGVVVTKAVVLFTDGVPHTDDKRERSETFANVMRVLNDLMDNEVFVVIVGVNNYNETMLKLVSQNDFGFAFTTEEFEGLQNPTFPDMIAESLELNCNCPQDIYMLIDSSGSIGKDLFDNYVKPFAKHMVDAIDAKFPIGPGADSRLGVTSFSRNSAEIVKLPNGTSVSDIKKAIDNMQFSDSWTHAVEFSEMAHQSLLRNARGYPMHLILITDGIPTSSQTSNQEETKEKLIAKMQEINDDDIRVSIYGFAGDRAPDTNIDEIFSGFEELSNLYLSKDRDTTDGMDDRFTDGRAHEFLHNFDTTCPVVERNRLCPVHTVQLVIVIDDTSEAAFVESKSVAQDVLIHVFDFDHVEITIVTSEMDDVTPVELADLEFTPQTSPRMNSLVSALQNANSVFNRNSPFPSISPTDFKVVLVIHSGVVNYDDFDTAAFKMVAYGDLKARNVQIHSMPLSMTNRQGSEVLQRLHTFPAPMLTRDDHYDETLQGLCAMLPDQPCEYMDVVLLVDISYSSNIDEVKMQVLDVLGHLRDSDSGRFTNVALVTFSEYASVHFDLEAGMISIDAVYDDMVNTIQNLKRSPHSMTNLAYALNMVTYTLFNSYGDRLPTDITRVGPKTNQIIIFSDAEVNMMTRGEMNTSSALMQASQVANVHWFKPSVIESGSYSDMAFQNMLPEVDSDDYRMAISLAMEAACPKTVLDIQPQCPEQVIFLVDSSGSIGDWYNYDDIKAFTRAVVDQFLTDTQGAAKISIGFYSVGLHEQSKNLIPFDDYSDATKRAAMLDDISDHTAIQSNTNLEMAWNQTKIQSGVDLSKTHFVLISDGETNQGLAGNLLLGELKANVTAGFLFKMSAVFFTRHFENIGMLNVLDAADQLEPPAGQENMDPLNSQANRDWLRTRLCPGVQV